MPDTSLYQTYRHKIATIFETVESHGAMPTDKFVGRVVNKALRPHPPAYVREGGRMVQYWFLRRFPRDFAMWLVWMIAAGALSFLIDYLPAI